MRRMSLPTPAPATVSSRLAEAGVPNKPSIKYKKLNYGVACQLDDSQPVLLTGSASGSLPGRPAMHAACSFRHPPHRLCLLASSRQHDSHG